jgi:NAD(P)H-flavin reductase
LQQRLQERQPAEDLVFFNCGPETMIDAAVGIEKQYTAPEKIYSAIDYVTKCGIGICGSCATKDGRRLCVDGPFMS